MQSCRVCLGNEDLTNIFSLENTAECLMCFANVNVAENDGLPQYICLLCRHELDICVSFKEKCESTYQILQQNSSLKAPLQLKCALNAVSSNQMGASISKESTKQILENTKDSFQAQKKIKMYNVSKGVEKFKIIPIKNAYVTNNAYNVNKQISAKRKVEQYLEDDFFNGDDSMNYSSYDDLSVSENEHYVNEVNGEHNQACDEQMPEEQLIDNSQPNENNDTNIYENNTICTKCNVIFSTEDKVNLHIEKAHSDTKQQCQVCLMLFPDELGIRKHLKEKHDIDLDETYSCKMCSDEFTSQAELNNHLCKKLEIYSCKTCQFEFARKSDLELHNTQFHRIPSFKCSYCNEKFALQDELKTHMKVHERVVPKCDICGKTLKTSKALKLHKKNHSNQQECEVCDMYFARKENLLKHMKTVHKASDFDEAKEDNCSEEDWNCEECGRKCKESCNSNKRISSKNGKALAHVCPFCEKLFRTSGGIECHTKVHTQEKVPPKLFTCYVCGDNFLSYDDLKKHDQTHVDRDKIVAAEKDHSYTHITVFEMDINNKAETNSNIG